MRLLNVAIVALALLSSVGGYLQQKKHLATTRALPARAALARYEATQKRRERLLVMVTAVLVAGAIVSFFSRLPR